jgi:two-component system, OmpR family, KDP operon response regulator KdpE
LILNHPCQPQKSDLKMLTNHCSSSKKLTKILIVDDDGDTTELLKLILESRDYEVFTANSGEQGIHHMHLYSPNILVIDLLLPDMDGISVLQRVRQFSHIPVLVISAMSKPNIVEQALDSGADDFIVKPMNSSILVASINNLVRRSQNEYDAWQVSSDI